jgi:NitT/TauT family transport system permease protein
MDPRRHVEGALRIALPLVVAAVVILGWESIVRIRNIPTFVLPAPSQIAQSLWEDFPSLALSAWATLRVTLAAFVLSVASGLALAIVFAHSRLAERALAPYAVILQVTPVVAIAPLVVIWVGYDRVELAVLILAWIVAFFPVLASATIGLRSADHNLIDLFRLYGASPWQRFARLEIMSALPYLLGGMKIAGGLALIGAVVAEFVAGSGAATGLAWRIIEAGNRLQIAHMFAALALLAALGVAIYFSLSLLEHHLLKRWHESARPRDR